MNTQTMHLGNKLQRLYSSKLTQLLRAEATPQSIRYRVLKAEADAILEQINLLSATNVNAKRLPAVIC